MLHGDSAQGREDRAQQKQYTNDEWVRGGEENSHGKRSLNQKDNPWAGMDSRPREVNYLNKVSTSSCGLTNVDLPGPEPSGQCMKPTDYICFGPVCISFWLEVKHSHNHRSLQGTAHLLLQRLAAFHRPDFCFFGKMAQACCLHNFSLVMFTDEIAVTSQTCMPFFKGSPFKKLC